MFNTLASYLLGNSVKNSTDTIPEDKNINTIDEGIDNNFKIIATSCESDDDEDWLLVEKGEGDSSSQTDSEAEIPFVEIKNNPLIRTNQSRNNSSAGSQDGAFNLLPSSPIPTCMDESWFVTPPPCFTSTGPINVETSPLENLLIEHPSMSVYHNIRNANRSDEVEEQDDMVLVDVNIAAQSESSIHPASERVSGHTTRLARVRAENHVDILTPQQVKHVVALKHSQKAHEKKNRQQMCRSAIERGNKIREVNSKGGRQKRSDMTNCKVISRANNNRKC